jgi:hypothetical protein
MTNFSAVEQRSTRICRPLKTTPRAPTALDRLHGRARRDAFLGPIPVRPWMSTAIETRTSAHRLHPQPSQSHSPLPTLSTRSPTWGTPNRSTESHERPGEAAAADRGALISTRRLTHRRLRQKRPRFLSRRRARRAGRSLPEVIAWTCWPTRPPG